MRLKIALLILLRILCAGPPWTCGDNDRQNDSCCCQRWGHPEKNETRTLHMKNKSLFQQEQQLNKQNINTHDKDRVRGWDQGPSQGYLVTGSPCCPQSWRQYKAQVISEPLRSQVLVGQGSTQVTRTKEQRR